VSERERCSIIIKPTHGTNSRAGNVSFSNPRAIHFSKKNERGIYFSCSNCQIVQSKNHLRFSKTDKVKDTKHLQLCLGIHCHLQFHRVVLFSCRLCLLCGAALLGWGISHGCRAGLPWPPIVVPVSYELGWGAGNAVAEVIYEYHGHDGEVGQGTPCRFGRGWGDLLVVVLMSVGIGYPRVDG
jgi:hypothetical protein